MEQTDFEIALNNYRNGIQKTIPAYLTGKMTDEEAWVDELALVLRSRDEVEWAFAVSPRLWEQFDPKVDELDRLLLTMREAILTHFPAYITFRQQFLRPRSHWWYYFDKIVSLPAQPANGNDHHTSPQGYWIPVVSPSKTTT